MRHFLWWSVVIAGSLGVCQGLALGQSNKPASDDQTLRALIKEVHELRVALQRNSLIAYRSQITVERIRALRERVDRLTKQLEDVRGEIAAIESETPRMAERIKELESEASAETVDERHKVLGAEVKDLKVRLDSTRQRDAQLHERETQLSTELAAERGKLDELDYRIEALDRELENEAKREGSGDNAKEPKQQQ
jgi:chromosome segregation ATPase